VFKNSNRTHIDYRPALNSSATTAGKSDNRSFSLLLEGLTLRSELTDCPVDAFQVEVKTCSGNGDCSSVCMVQVFDTDSNGRCVVANESLCFGCMACVAQCLDHGVVITAKGTSEHLTIDELLR
jgi:MinD superfamily P-loop ATPase